MRHLSTQKNHQPMQVEPFCGWQELQKLTPTPETLQSATEKEKEQRQRRADSKELQKQASARAASLSSSKITNS